MDQQSGEKPEVEILYIIPSISVFVPDQFYIFTEAEREYDALAILRIGNNAIPVFIEHTSGETSEMEKLVREQRVWPYPTVWITEIDSIYCESNVLKSLSPRLADDKDLRKLLSKPMENLVNRIQNLYQESTKQESRGRQPLGGMGEVLRALFRARSKIYMLGTEIPLYIQFSGLYISRAKYPGYKGSPWGDVRISLRNSLDMLRKGSEGAGQDLGILLSRYADLLGSEIEILDKIGIIYERTCIKDIIEEAEVAINASIDISEALHRGHLILVKELRELAESNEIYIVALPQRPTLRKRIRETLPVDREAMLSANHSLTMAYIIMARLVETIAYIEKLRRQNISSSDQLKKLVLCFVGWNKHECIAAYRDFLNLLRNPICREAENMARNLEKISECACLESVKSDEKGGDECAKNDGESVGGISKGSCDQGSAHKCSVIFLVVGDYNKEELQKLVKDPLSATCLSYESSTSCHADPDEKSDKPSLLETISKSNCKIAIAVVPHFVYKPQDRRGLARIVELCPQDLGPSRDQQCCLIEYPVGIYIGYISSPAHQDQVRG